MADFPCTWWLVRRYDMEPLPLKVVKESERFVWVIRPDWNSDAAQQQKKDTAWERFFPTEDAALLHIRERLVKELADRTRRYEESLEAMRAFNAAHPDLEVPTNG